MKLHPAVLVEDTRTTLRDGVRLAADVIRPADDEAHPVLLIRTPYSRTGAREFHDPVRWARDGWAVVIQDVRGRFDSAGVFAPFHQEIDDGYDTVEWCATQPWSTGAVAMAGLSYVGATQWLAAASRHPALKAISPGVTAAAYRDGWFFDGDAFELGFPASWALMLAFSAPKAKKRTVSAALRLAGSWERLLSSAERQDELAGLLPAYDAWRRDDREYWRAIDVSRRFSQVDVAGWHLAGWYDVFCDASLAAYVGMTQSAPGSARSRQRLVVGPWTHAGVFQQSTPEVDFGLDGSGLLKGYPDEMRDFLRAAVENREPTSGVVVFVMGEDAWRELPAWPPPATRRPLFLDRDASLSWTPPVERGVDRWSHDPTDPAPTRGGRTLNPILPMAGPMDQRPLEERADVLVYTTAPLDADLTIIGPITADVAFSSSAEQADLVVKVCDVHPDGRSMNVVDGARRSRLTPGRARRLSVDVGSTAMTFRRGHRIRVDVSSASFPRLTVLAAGDQAVFTGGPKPSSITLPVIS